MKKWWNNFRFFRKCECCGKYGAQHYHQNTSYVDKTRNWVKLCKKCSDENDEYWQERWAEYYGGLL